ncbi:MAG: hypothetical protein B6I26_03455 [Desulfobacteraceae bacterium 4572_130]|nr:MAG: hypothetical protein B6I26_03455 [Desulfobacteraceae bacterium 4572_130]
MKKLLGLAMLVFLITGFAVPSIALDFNLSGELKVEGILNSKETMNDNDATSDYRQMRLRVKTDIKITEDLSLVTRFDALEKILSSKDSAFDNNEDDDNIDFDRAYINYKSPIGLFRVGRMQGSVWGTTFCDDDQDADRILYVAPLSLKDGTLYIGAVAEKVAEYDKGILSSDSDNDKYYLSATYKTKNYKTGFLTALYNFKTFQDPGQAFATKDVIGSYNQNSNLSDYQFYLTSNDLANNSSNYTTWYATNAAIASGGGSPDGDWIVVAPGTADSSKSIDASSLSTFGITKGTTCQAKVYLLSPYFDGKFGNFGIKTELDYVFGTAKYDDPNPADAFAIEEDHDVRAYGLFAEGSYDLDAVTFQAGFALVSGDADYTDDEVNSMGYVSPGVDWAKLFILNADDHGMNTTLGNGVGNHVGDGFGSAATAMCDGYQLFYLGADWAVTDSFSLGAVIGISKAYDVPTGQDYDDEQGIEYNLNLTWNITDNLEYSALFAYLDGGDYWKTRATGTTNPNIDPDVYSFYHKLSLTF